MNTGMKTAALAAFLAAAAYGPDAQAKVNVNINLGAPGPVIVSSPTPVVVEQRGPRRFAIERQPRFLYTPDLGFYVSVGAPYDIIYYQDQYYIYDGGEWYRSSNYRGPWMTVRRQRLPTHISRYRYEEIRQRRDREYRRAESWERQDRNRPNDRYNDRSNDRSNDRDRQRDADRPRWR
ncbi:hypothetical protein [Pelodictyon luteolum]|uniref:Uncharacterized protein n=1 Tax=Chlorobium luteolum (strain DSM 273 / BCRC 81028 / 2530) TaxID=319225 RepID=Q3B4S6_CHLL3|nr:hypothetical protein [Pelodictyon luteolum]ABB23655.1 conserved hypothetical protein [Pelodictyon luteolum DSM 273]